MDVKTQSGPVDNPPAKDDATDEESWFSFGIFLLKLMVVMLLFRSFVFSPFSIPSESMLPRLWNGDYLIAAKWPYGFSRYSLPFSAPLIPGRILAGPPEPGDVVIFKHPIDRADYIKRAIALPGDRIGMVEGQIILNGELVPKVPIDDFIIPVSLNTGCVEARFQDHDEAGNAQCRYPRFRETLPNGVSYDVLDFGLTRADNFAEIIVPEGQMFVMGDNRDNSQDSRYPARAGGGVGLVSQDDLVGRATILMWSTDGGAEWVKPWTWFTAARWGRLGDGL
jgi:signal peptidase I